MRHLNIHKKVPLQARVCGSDIGPWWARAYNHGSWRHLVTVLHFASFPTHTHTDAPAACTEAGEVKSAAPV